MEISGIKLYNPSQKNENQTWPYLPHIYDGRTAPLIGLPLHFPSFLPKTCHTPRPPHLLRFLSFPPERCRRTAHTAAADPASLPHFPFLSS